MKKSDLPKLKDHTFPDEVLSPHPAVLKDLYVPALECAVRYDRSAAYFTSSSLSAAAAGFAGLIRNLEALGKRAPKPAIRLLVNEELNDRDVKALTEKRDFDVLEQQLRKRFRKNHVAALEYARLEMLGWMVAKGYLDIRVVIPNDGGIFHTKFGVIYDAHRARLAFFGSSNETWQGLKQNVDELYVLTSWRSKQDRTRIETRERRFNEFWENENAETTTYELPEAVKQDLIKYAPEDVPSIEPGLEDLQLPKLFARLQFLSSAAWMPDAGSALDNTALVTPWPHQTNVVEDTVRAWPAGRLLCDEVGMGKTIEAILIIRRLLAGRGVKRLLLLVPAGLVRQWQGELREKGGLLVPFYEQGSLYTPGQPSQSMPLPEALSQPLLLISREFARRKNTRNVLFDAEPWDLVLLDEAHAARRSEAKATSFNQVNLLLDLLRLLKATGRAKSLMLLSATPMQMFTWEPWDLIDLLGLGGYWTADIEHVESYYRAAYSLKQGSEPDDLELLFLCKLLADEAGFPEFHDGFGSIPKNAKEWKEVIEMFAQEEREQFGDWLLKHSPLQRWMHRNTRDTLREYYRLGQINQPPPNRDVDEVVCELQHPFEREAYQAIKGYVETRAKVLESERKGKGFIMTVYQRRAMSSFHAFKKSLLRRRTGLLNQITDLDDVQENGLIEQSELADLEDDYDYGKYIDQGLPEDYFSRAEELASIKDLLELLERIGPEDSKFEQFLIVLNSARIDGRPVLVFTSYTDTLNYLRDKLYITYGASLACYTGSGGELYEEGEWIRCTKSEITSRLSKGHLNVVLCTDAASEGLNLQSAGAIINYDLPWNPSRVEQRIGRIDRIGQLWNPIIIRNLLIPGSIDDRVYRVLRRRCGLFERFVGHMQPVLSFARRSLRESAATTRKNIEREIEKQAREAESDIHSKSVFVVTDAKRKISEKYVGTVDDLSRVFKDLAEINYSLPFNVRRLKDKESWSVTFKGKKKRVVSHNTGIVEMDESATALDLLNPLLAEITAKLGLSKSLSPILILVRENGPFRLVHAWWIGRQPEPRRIHQFGQLDSMLSSWDGYRLQGEELQSLQLMAEQQLEKEFETLSNSASEDQYRIQDRNRSAAVVRLKQQYLRTLVSLDRKTRNLHTILSQGPNRINSYGQIIDRTPAIEASCKHEDLVLAGLYVDTMRKSAYQAQAQIRAALDDYRWGVS